MKKKIVLIFTMIVLAFHFVGAQQSKMNVKIESDNLCFDVLFQGKEVISTSPLGMNIDNEQYGKNVRIQSINQLKDGHKIYTIERDNKMSYQLEVREFNDGIALRYRIPSNGPRCIYGEATGFTFPSGTRVWYASGPFQYGWLQIYQDRLVNTIKDELLAPPATFLLPNGTYAAITEADLFNFHGAVLFGKEENRVQFGYVENKGHVETGIVTGLPPSKYWHEEVRDIPWITNPDSETKEIVTPWRILMLGADLNALVNNGIIAKVSRQPNSALFPQGGKTEWIKPGRAVFTWLVEGPDRLSVENHKRYVDGASELGLQSIVVDDGWELWPKTEKNGQGRSKWDMLKELVNYARPKNVDVWVWRASSPRSGNDSDIGLVDAGERSNFMAKCAETGVKGLKIDYANEALHSL